MTEKKPRKPKAPGLKCDCPGEPAVTEYVGTRDDGTDRFRCENCKKVWSVKRGKVVKSRG